MEDLKSENAKLKEMVNFKSDIISMISHQLRTSLTASKWILKMLLDGDLGELTEEQRNFIKKTHENNEKMICLVSEMININKENNTEITHDFDHHDIVGIVEDVLEDFIGEAKEKKVTIHFTKPNEIFIRCDQNKIKTAIQALMENAIKYNKEKGSIFVNLESDGHDVTLSVRDTGIGICKDEHDQIFNKFFRAQNAKKRENVGSGLGLFATKNIIDRHGGKIWFESKENEGTTFFVSLPIQKN